MMDGARPVGSAPGYIVQLLNTLLHVVLLGSAALACSHVDRGRGGPGGLAEASGAAAETASPPAAEADLAMVEAMPAAPAARPSAARSAGRRMNASAVAPAPAGPAGTEAAGPRSPVLIYTAQLTMAIFEVAPGLKAVEEVARELGGFLARQTNQAITIRVPAARFHEALGKLEKIGDVTSREINAQDVTQEYFDLEVRIKSARAVRERLEQLLSRASKVDESIAIERELERVVGEIERLEGRLKFLQDRAQFSTISVTFAPRPKELVAKDTFKLPFPWLDQLGLGRLLDLR
jgi:hypothetical protein